VFLKRFKLYFRKYKYFDAFPNKFFFLKVTAIIISNITHSLEQKGKLILLRMEKEGVKVIS
jgi:hypothetical protein